MSSLFFITRCLQLCHSIQRPVTQPQEGRVHTQPIVQSGPRQDHLLHVLRPKCSPASPDPLVFGSLAVSRRWFVSRGGSCVPARGPD